MIKAVVKITFITFLIFSYKLQAQISEPKLLLDSINSKLNKVNDYSADVKIKLNVSFIKIPVKEAKVFYKKPDKIKMKSTGFALLPKKGINFSLAALLNKSYTSVWIKKELINGNNCDVIKIIPLTEEQDILLATVWIDRKKQLLLRVDANTKSNGSFLIDFVYNSITNVFDLPEKLKFTFDVNKMSLPMGITGDFDSDKAPEKNNKPQKATLSLIYSNYLVNKGIPDSFFTEENKSKKK
jgi:outer membrane lipoprotein-sorting protein